MHFRCFIATEFCNTSDSNGGGFVVTFLISLVWSTSQPVSICSLVFCPNDSLFYWGGGGSVFDSLLALLYQKTKRNLNFWLHQHSYQTQTFKQRKARPQFLVPTLFAFGYLINAQIKLIKNWYYTAHYFMCMGREIRHIITNAHNTYAFLAIAASNWIFYNSSAIT